MSFLGEVKSRNVAEAVATFRSLFPSTTKSASIAKLLKLVGGYLAAGIDRLFENMGNC